MNNKTIKKKEKKEKRDTSGCQWLMSVIPATQEAAIRKLTV
jgi:hypothetical protein